MGSCQSTEDGEKRFGDVYKLGETLGAGAFAEVKQATKKGTTDSFAIKMVIKSKLGEDDEKALKEEIAVLSSLRHGNIVRLYETYEDKKFYYLVTEEMYGGELFDRIVQKNFYNEKEARDACRSLFEALSYLQTNRIAHRDLKPENILLWTPGDDSCIKLADFGFAKRIEEGPGQDTSLKTQCGTPGYVAPELLEGKGYGLKADMWSMGVISYVLLGGYPPFLEQDQKILFRKIRKGDWTFHPKYWGNVSKEAKNLISSMLTVNPKKRISADKALEAKWMTQSDDNLANKDLGKNLEEFRKFNAKRKFKAAVRGIITANMLKSFLDDRSNPAQEQAAAKRVLTKEDKADLKETFDMFDVDGGGTIDKDELKSVLTQLGIIVTNTELRKMIAKVDENDDGEIDFKEFLSMMKWMPDNESELKKAFAFFDVDGDGTTTKKELKRVMKKFGQKLTKPELDAVIAEVDTDGNGEIDFEEFKYIMSKA